MPRNVADLRQQDVIDHVVLTAYLAEHAEWDNRHHLDRIRRYTYLLASETGLSPEEAELLSVACMLHDVGKVRLPLSILTKTADLDPAEYKVIERHTVDGAQLLSGSGSEILQAGETIALTHHERWDGSGYPSGLKGEAIPVPGRIMALADVFDALTTKRTYKAAIDASAAADLIQGSSGTLFDPSLVSIFAAHAHEFSSILHMQDKKAAAR